MRFECINETYTRTRVGITAVHKAVNEGLALQSVLLGDIAQVEQVIKRTVYTTVTGQSHDMQVLAVLLGVAESRLDLRILQYTAILAGAVDLHEVLIYNTSRTNIKVTHLGVTHLSVRQTDILTTGLQLRVRISRDQVIPIRCRCRGDNIIFLTVTDSPTVENH